MKKFLILFVVLVILALSVGAVAAKIRGPTPLNPQFPQKLIEQSEMVNETPSTWFVEFSSPPAVEGTPKKTLSAERSNFRKAAKIEGLEYKERYAFETLFNGLSIRIDLKDLGTLARIKGVKSLYPVLRVSLSPVAENQLHMSTALAMTGADIVHSELGFTGEGVKIGIIDTGIDYHHPDLGGCFGPGCKVAYGTDLAGDVCDEFGDPIPDPDPDDFVGHGTHVAGIAAANGTVVGVAPGAILGAYKISGACESSESDIYLAAMEAALADGMDVLNMSWGSYLVWPQYPTAKAADRLVNAGMVVVASMGNGFYMGVFNAAAPAVGEKVIGVTSFDNTYISMPYFEVGNDNDKVSYVEIQNALPAPTSGTGEIVYIGDTCNYNTQNLSGKTALISYSFCWIYDSICDAMEGGATAVIIQHAYYPGNPQLWVSGVNIPAVSISYEDGELIKAQTAPVMITWSNQLASFPNPTGGLISEFCSYGPSPDLSLKPDIGAPGGSIYSTFPLELGGYTTMGGTSMAAPYVAGAVALYLEAHPKTNSQVMRDILQNSADPQVWSLGPGYGFLDHTFRQGAGLLDIDDAIRATTKITPGKIELKEIESGTKSIWLEVENKSETAVTYDLSYVSAVGTHGIFYSEMSFWLTDELVEFPVNAIQVLPDETIPLELIFTPSTGPDLGLYGGYIVFTPREGGQVYRVPYMGFIGDYQMLPVLDANPWGFPFLNPSWDGDYIFSMDFIEIGPNWYWLDIPEIDVQFAHHARKVKFEIHDANSGKNWGTFREFDYLGHSESWPFYFDGTTMKGAKTYTVPDGDYVMVIIVLKALGDETNPDHWETWTSPVFTIDRS